jgi:general stress protein YciG
MPSKRQPTADGKCRAETRAGRPCAAPAVRGGIYCALHNDPQRAAELGRKGGTRGRKVYESAEREVSAPHNARDVKNLLAEVMAEIRAGKMDPKLGTTLGYLGTSLLKAIETSDLEERLERLENGLNNPSQKVGENHD